MAARGARAAAGDAVIGYLSSLTQADSVHFDAAFRRGLSEMGYVEGQNVSIEYRWISDRYNPLAAMALDLMQRQVAMIGAFGPPAVIAAKAAVLNAVTENDFDQVFASVIQQRADALFVSADPFLSSRREHLVALAARHAIPTLYEIREFVEVGGLMSYGTVLREGYYKGGIYAGRILKGINPAELPVEQVNKLELVINLNTAKALGLEIPDKLLALADEVIE